MKMKPMKSAKGQASIEYLMTYGWAILIIAVAVVVLYQMGVFKPFPTPPGCTGFSQVRPVDWKASKAGSNLTLVLSNDAGVKIQLKEINATVNGKECTKLPITDEMRAGQTLAVGIQDCLGVPEVKEYYRADMVISYKHIASGLDHNSVGECHGSAE